MATEPWHPFRSEASRQEYLAFYDARARRWPCVPSESKMVRTPTFGDTFVRVQGPPSGPPLLLLPGDSESSLSWIPVIEAFASRHRVYAVDHIYDIGRSICRRGGEPRRPDDFVRWLDELLDQLQLYDRLSIVAHSYGGWMAALYALKFPERLAKLVLISPCATVLHAPPGLLVRAVLYGTVPCCRRPIARRYLYWYAPDSVRRDETRVIIDEMVDEDIIAKRCYRRRRFVLPTVLSDEDWHRLSLAVPTLYLIGRNDVSYSAERAVQRLSAVAPRVKTEITDGDHHLTIVEPEWVIRQVLGFLA